MSWKVPALRTALGCALLVTVAGVGARAAATLPTSLQVVSFNPGLNFPGSNGSGIGIGDSNEEVFTPDGRFCAFLTTASLSNADINGLLDVYVTDRLTGAVQQATLTNPTNEQSSFGITNNDSLDPSVDSTGRYVAYGSFANNIVTGDTNNAQDVFVRDMRGITTRVSVSSAGAQGNAQSTTPAISADATIVAYQSDATNLVAPATTQQDIFVTALEPAFAGGQSLQPVETALVSATSDGVEGNGQCRNASVSSDGEFVCFESDATNLVPGDTNGASDIFVKDIFTGEIEMDSVSSADSNGDVVMGDGSSTQARITPDGQFVTFISTSDNLTDDDTGGFRQVFVHDRLLNTTELVSVGNDGTPGDADSGDADDQLSIYSPTAPTSGHPAISADGQYVVFTSLADNLGIFPSTNGVTNAFIRDIVNGTTTELSQSDDGVEADAQSSFVNISADGSTIGFSSAADNLVTLDLQGFENVYAKTINGVATSTQPPVVVVGPDQEVQEGDQVTLDASGSFDPAGNPITFLWTQNTSDPALVTLSDPTSPTPTFIAPEVLNSETLTFEVTVSDGINAPVSATTTVTVDPADVGTITGQVTDPSGDAVFGATVTALRDDGAEATPVSTDGSGTYVITDARAGDNTVTASVPGLESVSQDVTVTPDGTSVLDLQFIAATASIQGAIQESDGTPIVGATVSLVDASQNPPVILDASTTDDTGFYLIGDVDAQTLAMATVLQVSAPGFIVWNDSSSGLQASTSNIRNYRYGSLTVTVKTKPASLSKKLNGTLVLLPNLLDSSGQVPTNAVSKKVTKVVFPNVPAGAVRVQAVNPGLSADLQTVTVASGNKKTSVTLTLQSASIF